MPLSINTNIASMTAQRSFMNSNAALETAFERLSTGKRVNSAVDDAAGLAIGKELESRVSGLNQAIRNTNDGISIIQIAEGALDEGTTILQRMRDLAVQAANDSLSADERAYLEDEADKLEAAFDDLATAAKWNGSTVFGVTFTIQTGADATDEVSVAIGAATADHFFADASGDADADVLLTTHAGAEAAITNIDNALKAVALDRAGLGALQSQLESTVRNLANVAENTAAAAGRIMDTDYAAETANLTKAQILQQAATSILAQANAQPQSVLALLQ
jgi:flagellin